MQAEAEHPLNNRLIVVDGNNVIDFVASRAKILARRASFVAQPAALAA